MNHTAETGAVPVFWRSAASSLKRRPLRLALGLAASAGCLALAFRSVSLSEIQKVAGAVPAKTALLYVLLASLSLLLRSLRWSVLLRPAGTVSKRVVFAVNSAGQMANNLLPARAGDLFRAASLGRAGITTPAALATVFVERVLDTGFLVLISAIAIGRRAAVPVWLATAARFMIVLSLLGLAFAVATPHLEGALLKLLGLVVSERWHARLDPLVRQFVLGLRSLSSPWRVCRFFLLTILIWFLDGLGVYTLGRGLGLTLSPSVVVLLLTSLALSSAVPAAPGNVGVYQMVGVTVLAPLGVPRLRALVLVIALQILIIGNLLFWGTASLWYLGKNGLSGSVGPDGGVAKSG